MSELAFEVLLDGVRARFETDENDALILFGERQPPQRGMANRVVFVPGDSSGNLGDYGDPIKARVPMGAHVPRSLRTMREVFRVFCWGFDASAPEDEAKQYAAARYLHDQVIRAIYLAPMTGRGNFEISKPAFVPHGKERKFGFEIVFTLVLFSKIPDDPGPTHPRYETEVPPPFTGIGPGNLTHADGTEESDPDDTTTGVAYPLPPLPPPDPPQS